MSAKKLSPETKKADIKSAGGSIDSDTKSSAQKPSIILLHGFRGSPLGLEEVARIIREAGYEVFVPPIPPFSGAKLPEYTPEAYVSYLHGLIDSHGIEQPILVGHSMGSIVAAAVAHTEPDLINEKLILLSPISARTTRLIAPLVPLSAGIPRLLTDYITTRFLFIPHDHKMFKEALKITNRCSGDKVPRVREVYASAKFSAQYSVADFPFKKQTLFLAGESDRIVNKNNTEKLAKKIGAELQFIPDSGHLHNYEKPRETAEAILEFLAK